MCYTRSVTTEQGATIRIKTDDFLSVGKAAKALGTSRWSIYRWVDAKKIIGVKLGGILFIPISEIERKKNEKATEETVA
ncbi:hypothetical protein ES703_63839 [subsurface metagenome]